MGLLKFILVINEVYCFYYLNIIEEGDVNFGFFIMLIDYLLGIWYYDNWLIGLRDLGILLDLDYLVNYLF